LFIIYRLMNHYWLRFLIYANYNITDSEVLTLSDFYIVNTIHSFFLCNFEKMNFG